MYIDFFREQKSNQDPLTPTLCLDPSTSHVVELGNPSPPHTYEEVGRIRQEDQYLKLQENVAYSCVAK